LATRRGRFLLELRENVDQPGDSVAQFAFPDHLNTPSLIRKPLLGIPVALHVAGDLSFPVSAVRRRHAGPWATVPVPETPVDEHGYLVPRKHEIRSSGQSPVMQSIAIARPMNCAANAHLGLRVPGPDPRHHCAALCGSERIDSSSCHGGQSPARSYWPRFSSSAGCSATTSVASAGPPVTCTSSSGETAPPSGVRRCSPSHATTGTATPSPMA
jgi:hypothetical protein